MNKLCKVICWTLLILHCFSFLMFIGAFSSGLFFWSFSFSQIQSIFSIILIPAIIYIIYKNSSKSKYYIMAIMAFDVLFYFRLVQIIFDPPPIWT